MALPPKFAGHKLVFGEATATGTTVPPARHTLEVYLDYVCPFSNKIFGTLTTVVVPMIKSNPAWASSVELIFRQQIQPWHPSSTLTHEAGVVVMKLAPEKFWAFSTELFAVQKSFFDVNVVKESRNETYKRLAEIAGKVGVDEAKVLEMLTVPDKPAEDGSLNVGNAVTNDLKVLVKMARLTGVHVTPTVIYDGVVQNDISSGWSGDQWKEWLGKNVV
jgi:predicted DsbA family dithiol-disulfide isomerase